jgi:hypothetical protein
MRALLAVLLLVLARAQAPLPSPVPAPARPAPFFSWAVLPRAFHGANRSGLFTPAAIAQLSGYSMVTLEKWYTPCAAPSNATQGNASCSCCCATTAMRTAT